MNIELICKTVVDLNSSWIYLHYFKDVTTFIFLTTFISLLYKLYMRTINDK